MKAPLPFAILLVLSACAPSIEESIDKLSADPEFVPAEPICDEDVQQIVLTTAKRVVSLCQRRGLLEEGAADLTGAPRSPTAE